jgi:release factor glutamine methyltransferase
MSAATEPAVAARDDPLGAHEPREALTDDGDGLSALSRVVAGAPQHLAAGGWLLVEHGWDQADAVRGLIARAGLIDVATVQDAEHRDRCSLGRMAGTPPGE